MPTYVLYSPMLYDQYPATIWCFARCMSYVSWSKVLSWMHIYLADRSGGKGHWVQQDKLETWEVLTQPEMTRWLTMTCQRAQWQMFSIIHLLWR